MSTAPLIAATAEGSGSSIPLIAGAVLLAGLLIGGLGLGLRRVVLVNQGNEELLTHTGDPHETTGDGIPISVSDEGATMSDMAPLLHTTPPAESPGSRKTVSIAIEAASASHAAPGDLHETTGDGSSTVLDHTDIGHRGDSASANANGHAQGNPLVHMKD